MQTEYPFCYGLTARLAALWRDKPQLHNAVIITIKNAICVPCGLQRTQWRGTLLTPDKPDGG